jgi:hypothetical protein
VLVERWRAGRPAQVLEPWQIPRTAYAVLSSVALWALAADWRRRW